MPNADSKNKNIKQIRQIKLVKIVYEFITTNVKNMIVDKTKPIVQANFFCAAPTYSGVCLLTIQRPIIKVGEYLGLTRTRMIKSVKKKVIKYFTNRKSSKNILRIQAENITKNIIPADALISLSFNTGMLYPSTVSPNFLAFIFTPFLLKELSNIFLTF